METIIHAFEHATVSQWIGAVILAFFFFYLNSKIESLVGELQALDAEYQNLANQEEARFNEERAQADAARQALAQNEQVYNELSQRAQRLQAIYL